MNDSEKILSILIAILTFLIVVLSVKLLNTKEQIGEVENERIKVHNSRIAIYDSQILTLNTIINKLQFQLDSLENEKQQVKIVTITEIDSVRLLPFDGRANFWAIQTAYLDSSRTRYFSIN